MNPYAPPQSQQYAQGYYGQAAPPPFLARLEGQNLVLSKNAYLPNVCVKCAACEPMPITRKRKNYTFIPWYGRFFGVLGILITQKKASLDLPICQPCGARASNATLVMWLVTVGVMVVTGLMFAIASAADSDALMLLAFAFLMACFVVPMTLFLAWARDRVFPQTTFIDDQVITLARVHPGAIQAALHAANAAAGFAQQQYAQQQYAQSQYPQQYGGGYGPPSGQGGPWNPT